MPHTWKRLYDKSNKKDVVRVLIIVLVIWEVEVVCYVQLFQKHYFMRYLRVWMCKNERNNT